MSNIGGGNFAPQDVVVDSPQIHRRLLRELAFVKSTAEQNTWDCAVILPPKIAQVLRASLYANKRCATSMVVGDKMRANKKKRRTMKILLFFKWSSLGMK